MPSLQLLAAKCASGEADAVRALLEGEEYPTKLINDVPFLHFAVYNGNIGVVKALLDAGAPIEATDNAGQTALHIAAYNGKDCEQILETLIKRGANVKAVDNMGECALVKAARHGSKGGAKKPASPAKKGKVKV